MPSLISKKIGLKSLKILIKPFTEEDFVLLNNVDKDISIMLILLLINHLLNNGLMKVLTFYFNFIKNMDINGH
jgi:hypothetical protein